MVNGDVLSGVSLLVLNLLIILILLWILTLVHKQAKHLHDLDTQLKTRETARKEKEKE